MSEKISLSQLISQIGDANVEFQPLSQSIVKANWKNQKSTVTFATESKKVWDMAMNDGKSWCGLVVWIPRDKLPEKLKTL